MQASKEIIGASTSLLILGLLAAESSYGYALVRRLNEAAGGLFEWQEGTVYPLLHKLEKQEQIRARWQETEAGRRRKYYFITAKGRRALSNETEQWSAFHVLILKLQEAATWLSFRRKRSRRFIGSACTSPAASCPNTSCASWSTMCMTSWRRISAAESSSARTMASLLVQSHFGDPSAVRAMLGEAHDVPLDSRIAAPLGGNRPRDHVHQRPRSIGQLQPLHGHQRSPINRAA